MPQLQACAFHPGALGLYHLHRCWHDCQVLQSILYPGRALLTSCHQFTSDCLSFGHRWFHENHGAVGQTTGPSASIAHFLQSQCAVSPSDGRGPLAAGVVACLPREGWHGQQHLSDRPLNPDGLHTIFTARHVECSEQSDLHDLEWQCFPGRCAFGCPRLQVYFPHNSPSVCLSMPCLLAAAISGAPKREGSRECVGELTDAVPRWQIL
mmetsp:Transcript_47301/g.103173  ORF Transcript_47301/g.103173 Transcript_47301/m.103173 type:complete len:209 (-) Transcript_47301:86-712(-)